MGSMPIRFGVLSTARIATQKVIPALQRGTHTEVVAIASRDSARARQVALDLGIPRSHGSYADLLADRSVDAVYIPLPNDQHVPWAIRSLEAGKHVLCEKPLALTAAEAALLLEASQRFPRLKVMEAFVYRHHPQWTLVKELVNSGRIGTLRTIQVYLGYFNRDPKNIRHDPAKGGGGMMDIGCYCISVARWLFGKEPRRVLALVEMDPDFGTDRLASAILDFETGQATFTCSTQVARFQQVNLVGTEGWVDMTDAPFNAPTDRGCVVRLGTQGEVQRFETPACNQYTLQGDNFAQAILEDLPVPSPLSDAVSNMQVIERLLASGRSGTWS
jgi:predicted dehydrogenase